MLHFSKPKCFAEEREKRKRGNKPDRHDTLKTTFEILTPRKSQRKQMIFNIIFFFFLNVPQIFASDLEAVLTKKHALKKALV